MGTPINAQTDENGLRYYEWNGQRLLSATSLRRVLGLSFGLHNWTLKQVIDAAVMTDRGPLGDDEFSRKLWAAARAKRDAAASLGTSVHEAAEQGVKAVLLDDADERKPFLRQYEEAIKTLGLRILINEAQVFNLTLGYAGSLDLIAEAMDTLPEYGLERGDVCVVDLKTGKGIYNDHALQLALYYGAEFVGGYDPIEGKDVPYEQATDTLRSVTGAAVLHLRPDMWEWVPIPMTDELVSAAVDLTRLAHWFVKYPTLEGLAAGSAA